MSIPSQLKTERTDITARRERARQTERSVVDFRFLRKTVSERVDRLARSAPTIRNDDELAGHVARVLRRSASRRPLDDLRNLAQDPQAFGQEVLTRWAELAGDVDPDDRELSVQKVGYDTETVSNGGRVGFDNDPHPFLTVFTAFLRGDAGAGAVKSAYRRDSRPLASAQALERSLLGLVGVLQDALEQHRDRLHQRRSEHVATLQEAWEQNVDPLEALQWGTPVALLPIRLETRFTEDNSQLKVRVYPDQIHVDSHEEPLTEAEKRWGKAFWTRLWFAALPTNPNGAPGGSAKDIYGDPANLPSERSRTVARDLFQQYGSELSTEPGVRFDEIRERAWAQGTERFGHERAAHIVHTLSPIEKQDTDVGSRILEGWSNGTAPLPSVLPLEFDDVDLRPSSWTQVPRAQLLPDRFVGYAYYPADDNRDATTSWSQRDDGSWKRRVGTEYVIRFTGNALREPLPTGPSPEVVARDDQKSRFDWMTDFSAARDAGMGLVVNVPSDDDFQAAGAFSRLLVTGVRSSMSPLDTAEALEAQIDAAHYTHGVELLKPGTATNNADEPSGHTNRPDPGETVDIEAGPSLVETGSDGERLAYALGVRPGVFDHVAGAGDSLDADAQAMNTVLWPVTLGYFAANLWGEADATVRLDDIPSRSGGPDDIDDAKALRWIESYRRHFAEYVRGDGPFPSLRVGEQPYGLLPATPFDVRSKTVPPTDVEAAGRASETKYATVPPMGNAQLLPELAERIQALAPIWTRSAGTVPSVGDDATLSEEKLLDLLAREPVAQTYHRRMWLMDDAHPLLSNLGLAGSTQAKTEAVVDALKEAGVNPSWLPRICQLVHLGISLDGDDIVVGDDLRDQVRTLLVGLRFADSFDLFQRLKDLRSDKPLQDKILRLSVLQAALAARVRVGVAYSDAANLPPEPAEFPLDPSARRSGLSNTLDVLKDTIPTTAPSSGEALTQHAEVEIESSYEDLLLDAVVSDVQSDVWPAQSPDPAFARYVSALERLKTVDADRLDRAFRSTMDLASHRLDAWWTSVATRQLSAFRDLQDVNVATERAEIGMTAHRPRRGGIHVGAFGFVENLSPGSGPEAEYLLAPSMDQAQTAAVLRAAHKGRSQQGHSAASSLSVDLSAEQVRKARTLLRGVRRGQTLAELLGYRFERLLREKSTSDHSLERYIHDYRSLASAVQGRLGNGDTNDEAKKSEAKKSDVVDGRALYRKWTKNDLDDEFVAPADRPKIDAIFREIGQSVDAVQDVLLAESVHHLIHGRPERSAAALEALSRGQAVPQELQVLDTPRTETNVTHRLAVLSGEPEEAAPPSEWQTPRPPVLSANQILGSGGSSTVPVKVRDDAEPTLNAWLGSMLPAPKDIGCAGEFRWGRERSFATGTFAVPKTSGTVTVQDVGFRPDVVELSIVLGAEASEPAEPGVFGEGHGVYRCAVEGIAEKKVAVFAAVERGGTEAVGETKTNCLLVRMPGSSSRFRASMTQMREDGFDLNVQSVGPAAGSVVHYRAHRLADPTSVRVGAVSAPASASTKPIDLSGGVGDDFDPDHVAFRAVLGPSGTGRVGVSRGDVVRRASGRDVLTTATEVDGPGTSNRVAARDDAAINAIDSVAGQGMRAAVTAFPEGDSNIELRFEAPQGGTYTDGLFTYVATESPVSNRDEPGGSTVHHPAVGHVVGPSAEGESMDVTLGFEPGLIEISVAAALTDDGSELPVSADPTGKQSGVAMGVAADLADQESLATGRVGGGFAALSSTSRIAVLLSEDSDGNPIVATSIRLAEVREDGFTLRFPSLHSDHENLCVFYRARPAEPSEPTFTAATSVRLSDLNLSPLDAVALTQGSEKEGDSQLERRIGYHCFRHAPSTRPPVPDDATLRLTFRDAGGADVSIADYVEMATTARDVIGEGRPTDAQDLVHPGEEGDRGYTTETKNRLKSRADTVRSAAKRTRDILKHRLVRLEARPNVCTQVDSVVRALRDAVAAVPFRQIVDVCTALSKDHPDGSTNNLQKTILGELGEIAKRLRAGPLGEEASVDVHPPAGGEETIRIATEIPEGVPVKIVFRSFADAVRFPQQTATATAQSDGTVPALINTRDLIPGTTFTATVFPQASGAETLTDVLFRRMEERSPEVWKEVLSTLSEEDFLDDHDSELVENVTDLSPELRRHVWAALRREGKIRVLEMIDATDAIERWNDVDQTLTEIIIDIAVGMGLDEQHEHLQELRDAGLLDDRQKDRVSRYPGLSGGEQRHLWASLSKEARITFLKNVGEEERADRYRSGASGPELHEGRVADHPDGGQWQDLQRYLEEDARFVPALLWLHRVRADLTGKEVKALVRAISDANDGNIRDEIDLMAKLPGLSGTGNAETRAFTSDHLKAAESVRDLLDFDLPRIVNRITEATRPLWWSGLTDLLAMSGDRYRPDGQRVWRDPDGSPDMLIEKFVEGEVRSRLARTVDAPRLEVPGQFGGYGLPVRDFLLQDSIPSQRVRFLEGLEELLQSPRATADAFGAALPNARKFVHDLHDVLHHVDAYLDDHSVSDLDTALSGVGRAIDQGEITDGDLRSIVSDPGALLQRWTNLAPKLVNAVRSYASGGPTAANRRTTYLDGVDQTLSNLKDAAQQQIGTLILGAAAESRPAQAFCAGVLESLRQALLRASYFGVYGSTPASSSGGTPVDETTLVEQARTVFDELNARLNRAKGAAGSSVAAQVDRLQELLGDGFTVIPPFAPANPGEVHDTFSSRQSLLGGDTYAPDTWLQRIARIREQPKSFQQLRTYADALGFATGTESKGSLRRTLAVGELPHDAGNHWLGRDDVQPSGGEVVFGVDMINTYADEKPLPPPPGVSDGSSENGNSSGNGSSSKTPLIAGLFIDEWVESVPADEETIGVGIQYDDPSTRAPQTALLAVPPGWRHVENEGLEYLGPTYWTDNLLRQTITETLDWMRRRRVDAEALETLGHVLPALYFPYNADAYFGATLSDTPTIELDDLDWL